MTLNRRAHLTKVNVKLIYFSRQAEQRIYILGCEYLLSLVLMQTKAFNLLMLWRVYICIIYQKVYAKEYRRKV